MKQHEQGKNCEQNGEKKEINKKGKSPTLMDGDCFVDLKVVEGIKIIRSYSETT
jgi:hypothetical protein